MPNFFGGGGSGSGGGAGSSAWADITAGTNTQALVVGSGGSFSATGTGIIDATKLDSVPADLAGIVSGDLISYDGINLVASKSGIMHRDDSDGTVALVAGDRGTLVTAGHATANAISIAQAGTVGFEEGYYVHVCTTGAGPSTITPTTSTINGNATLVLNQGDCALIISDATNYRASVSPRFFQLTYHHVSADGGVLEDTDDVPDIWSAKFPFQITQICGKADTGTSTFNIQRDDGTAASIASSNIVADTTEACTSTFTAGENIISSGHFLDFLQVTGATSGAPTRILVTISGIRI